MNINNSRADPEWVLARRPFELIIFEQKGGRKAGIDIFAAIVRKAGYRIAFDFLKMNRKKQGGIKWMLGIL